MKNTRLAQVIAPLLVAACTLTAILSAFTGSQHLLSGKIGHATRMTAAPATIVADRPPTEDGLVARTSYETVYTFGEGYRSVLSAAPTHYRDPEGRWQPIQPAFVGGVEGFSVMANTLKSQVGRDRAWVAAAGEGLSIGWETTGLTAITGDAQVALAHPLEEGLGKPAQPSADRTVLRYEDSWSDPSVAEWLISDAGSLEHLLVLDQAPAAQGQPDYLVMTAELQVWPGAELWADGAKQTGRFRTSGRLEIRHSDALDGLALDPIVAYEMDDRTAAIAGEYELWPATAADTWHVAVRTPWRWWADPDRNYPAAIDPRIVVLRATGLFANAVTYVSSHTNAFDPASKMRLGPYHAWDEETKGYVQFNTMPALLTTGGPMYITQATLRVHPGGYWANDHGVCHAFFGCTETIGPVGETFLFLDGFQMDASLHYVGSCPDDPACNGLDLDTLPPLSLNWGNAPDGNPVALNPTQPLVAPPQPEVETFPEPPDVHPDVYRPLESAPTYTEWDVTAEVRDWYQDLYDANSTNGRPTFMLQLEVDCPHGPPYLDEQEMDAKKCAALEIPIFNLQLIIDYEQVDLAAGQQLTNTMGVPSYDPRVFGSVEVVNGDWQTTDHIYRLLDNDAGTDQWRAVAVRGDHLADPAPNSGVGLKLWQYPLPEDASPDKPAGESNLDPAFTHVLFVDERHAPGDTADLRAAVEAVAPNKNAMETDANYRIQHQVAAVWNLNPGLNDLGGDIKSDELVVLREFELTSQDNVKIKVTMPPTAPLRVVLIPPTAGSDTFVVRDGKRLDGSNGVFGFDDTVPTSGHYLLAVINQDRPSYLPPPDPGPVEYAFDVKITVCPGNSIPVERFLGNNPPVPCQPIPLPSGAGRLPGIYRYVQLNENPDKWFVVHNNGGFIENPGDDLWCTTSEHLGAPVVAPLGPSDPLPSLYNGDWVVVAQGSVCLYNGASLGGNQYSGDLRTTDLSAVGLATLQASSPLGDRRGMLRKLMFGRTDFPPDPTAHGETLVTSAGDFIAANENTWVAMDPFRDYWGFNTTPDTPPSISTELMAFSGVGFVETDVIVDFDQPPVPVSWIVDWSVHPLPDPVLEGPNWDFESSIIPVLPLPGVATFSGLELRVEPSDPGVVGDLDYLTFGGPIIYQFRADTARVTAEPILGEASKVNRAIITPVGRKRIPAGEQACRYNDAFVSCLDLRDADGFAWDPVFGETEVAPWQLPDLQITGAAGSLLVSSPGRLEAFSVDHPDNVALMGTTVPFSFDTWGGEVTISEGPCGGGPVMTIVKGKGFISLPMIGGEGTYPGQNPISVTYTLCETELRNVVIQFEPPQPVPIASSGMEVTLLKGTVIIAPESTRITLQVNFQSGDNGTTLSEGVGTITLDTAGMLAIDAKGELVGNFNADFELDVAWNPLDLLLQGDVRYKNSNLITGYLYLHAWRGKGWQNKYPWIDDENLHFTGQIGGKVSVPSGELIDEWPLVIPPVGLSLGADISFGEFCANSQCNQYDWGVAATVNVFSYKAGVYADDSGPEIILGTKGKTLIDQAGTQAFTGLPVREPEGGVVVITPGLQQQLLLPDWSSSLEGLQASPNNCTPPGGVQQTCPFTVTAGTGRANFTTMWLNGDLTISLIDPSGTIYTNSDPAAGIIRTEVAEANYKYVNYTVNGTGPSGTIAPNDWHLRLNNVSAQSHYGLLFTADPPAPSLEMTSPAAAGEPATGTYNITWDASRGDANLEANVDLELFYAPVFAPEPLPPGNLFVTFPGDYVEQLGGINWDAGEAIVQAQDDNGDAVWRFTAHLSPGEYAFKVAVGGDWAENYGLLSEPFGQGITFTAPAGGGLVDFYYDRRDNFIATHPELDVVVLVGDMMSEVGGADNDPANLLGWLKPTDQGLYSLDLNLPAGSWQYKVALNESWTENYGQNGTPNGPSIPLDVAIDGTAVRFTYDEVSHIISHTVLAEPAGIPISITVPPNDGSFLWNTAGLASGEYLVGGRINDIQRGNGVITDWAPGTVVINDTTPPPVPTGVAAVQYLQEFGTSDPSELMVRWNKDLATPDLAGYQVEYEIPAYDWDFNPNNQITRVRRVLPGPVDESPFEWTHLTGILTATVGSYSGATTVCVRAYDASGNLSGCQPLVLTLPLPTFAPLPAPEVFNVIPENGQFFHLEWSEPPVAEGYLLRYGPAGCNVPGAATIATDGPPPIVINPGILDFDLFGLTPNQLYWFEIGPIDVNGLPGKSVRVERMLLDGPDNDGDGLPDAWAVFYNIVDPAGDLDQDGLNNIGEYQQFSNPAHADSDGDGFYDGYEAEWGTDVCGPEKPPYQTQPVLTLFGLQSYNLRTAVNQGSTSERLSIVNFGAGEMFWEVSTNVSWLSFDRTSGSGDASVVFTANPAGLGPGVYQATITVQTVPPSRGGQDAIAETARVEVSFVVMPEIVVEPPETGSMIFLPVVSRP